MPSRQTVGTIADPEVAPLTSHTLPRCGEHKWPIDVPYYSHQMAGHAFAICLTLLGTIRDHMDNRDGTVQAYCRPHDSRTSRRAVLTSPETIRPTAIVVRSRLSCRLTPGRSRRPSGYHTCSIEDRSGDSTRLPGRISAYAAAKLESDKGYTIACIKCTIDIVRKALNCGANVFVVLRLTVGLQRSTILNYCGVTAAERLACPPPTNANRVQSPPGSPDFSKWESCRMMPLVGVFSRESPVSPAPSFRCYSIFISITLIGSQDLHDYLCSKSGPAILITVLRGFRNHKPGGCWDDILLQGMADFFPVSSSLSISPRLEWCSCRRGIKPYLPSYQIICSEYAPRAVRWGRVDTEQRRNARAGVTEDPEKTRRPAASCDPALVGGIHCLQPLR
ncbi:hypothetical protein PR048_005923 [Dryococelus australis]|uniref:Uncharacterized protein n=1 Tax=Dryococelus australis TaxID=614101 RepID=A0ABQ9IA44_9NEOP|nr:hypothetical protein PR048_005923 [Dryococelus australis]